MRHTSLSNEIPALYHNIAKEIGFIDERSSVIMEEPVDIDVVIVIVNVVVVIVVAVVVVVDCEDDGRTVMWVDRQRPWVCSGAVTRPLTGQHLSGVHLHLQSTTLGGFFEGTRNTQNTTKKQKYTHSDCFWWRVWFLLGFPSVTVSHSTRGTHFFCATHICQGSQLFPKFLSWGT